LSSGLAVFLTPFLSRVSLYGYKYWLLA